MHGGGTSVDGFEEVFQRGIQLPRKIKKPEVVSYIGILLAELQWVY